jgi:hypothetical protein
MERDMPDKLFADDNLPFPGSEDGERMLGDEVPLDETETPSGDQDAPRGHRLRIDTSAAADTTMAAVDDRANLDRHDRNDFGQQGEKTR